MPVINDGETTMNDDKSPSTASSAEQRTGGRRRFLGAGSAVTPAVLSLFSQPAFSALCFSPSRSVSTNTSVAPGIENNCGDTRSPGYYGNGGVSDAVRAARWSPVLYTAQFHLVFPEMGLRNYGTKTLLEVIQLGGVDDAYQLAAHMISSYVNIMRGQVPVLTEFQLKAIWTQLSTLGYYQVSPSVQWSPEQVKNYLVNQHIANE